MFLKHDVQTTSEIKKSRFITLLHRVKTMDEARAFLAQTRKDYPDATHCCSAVKIGTLSHSSDDGEPAGTAGRPMLDVLLGSEADEIAAVVVRYFGGTLLGKGGLVRAYSGGVADALKEAEFLEAKTFGLYALEVPYDLAGKAETWLRSKGVSDLEADYGSQALYTFTHDQDLSAEIADRFSGSLALEKLSDIVREC